MLDRITTYLSQFSHKVYGSPQVNESDKQPDIRITTHFFASGLGSGLLPKAPGTWGSIAALPFAYLILHLHGFWQFNLIAIACIVGVWLCSTVTKDLGVQDHPAIVWDEFCGMWIALMFTPIEHFAIIAPIALILFRFFDIKKPYFIGYLDRTQKGGLGVMADDIAAGLCAFLIIHTGLFVLL